MIIHRAALATWLFALSISFAYGSLPPRTISDLPLPGSLPGEDGEPDSGPASGPGLPEGVSSSSLPDAPDADLIVAAANKIKLGLARDTHLTLSTDPFSAFAVGITTGLQGFGIEVATPLATKINLRAGVSFLNVNPTFTAIGTQIDGAIKFRNVNASVDIYPYRNTFHISPGLTMYNGDRVAASVNMVAGQTFEIENTNYTSSASDPVTGNFNLGLGHKIAPSLTVGFGNMLRRDSHWSIPTDFGFQYIGQPRATLTIQGTACDPVDGCTAVQTDPSTQQNIAEEQATLNKDISPLRFYPIVSVGLSYRFGHNKDMSPWR